MDAFPDTPHEKALPGIGRGVTRPIHPDIHEVSAPSHLKKEPLHQRPEISDRVAKKEVGIVGQHLSPGKSARAEKHLRRIVLVIKEGLQLVDRLLRPRDRQNTRTRVEGIGRVSRFPSDTAHGAQPHPLHRLGRCESGASILLVIEKKLIPHTPPLLLSVQRCPGTEEQREKQHPPSFLHPLFDLFPFGSPNKWATFQSMG